MEPIKLDELPDGKNCPKPGCGKREYLTRRSAGRDLSICPNGHSWDAVEVLAQQRKTQQANQEETTGIYDFLRDVKIIPEPARPRNEDSRRAGDIFRSPYTTFVDPLRETPDERRRRQEYDELRRGKFTKTPTIKMSRETLTAMQAMQDTGYFSARETKPDRLLGIPIVLDETIPPGLYVWSVGIEFENPFERFLKAMTKSVAEGFGVSPFPLLTESEI